MAKLKRLKLTLVRSPAGHLPRHRATIKGLGLKKMHHSAEVVVTPCIMGMINQVSYMLKVEEC